MFHIVKIDNVVIIDGHLVMLKSSEANSFAKIVQLVASYGHIVKIYSFKQVKFNLLREESEGYAKLIVELFDKTLTTPCAITRLYRLIGGILQCSDY